jgi:hypothetical protein
MAFGEEEKEVMTTMGESVGLGLLGGSTGKLRMMKKAFKGIVGLDLVPVSKKHKAMKFTDSNTSGLSSVAFTPVKGMELENPLLKAQTEPLKDKYFSSTTFKKPK